MNDDIVLDILLGAILFLFAAIGFWRGAAKEGIVTGGIFSGAAIASSWAMPWGADLADMIDARVGLSRLIVASIALFLGTVFIGYLGSALIVPVKTGLFDRFFGAFIAALNGGLLLHYALSFVERYLADESANRVLARSHISKFLLREFGWYLVGVASAVFVAILIGFEMRRRERIALLSRPLVEDPSGMYSDAARQRSVRLPRSADEGKYEPQARGFDPQTGRYAGDAPRLDDTIAMPPIDPSTSRFGGGTNGAGAVSGSQWYERPIADPGSQTQSAASQPTSPYIAQRPSSGSRQTEMRCRLCNGEIGPNDSFCPRCGATVYPS
jgi:uncharacterized membrane protein required for colicin V production